MQQSKISFTQAITSKSLSYFSKLAANLSYTKTARALGITQPALTQQIKKIEHSIGTPLFYSVGKQIHLTDAGQILLLAVEEVQTTIINAVDQIQQSTLSSTGTIKLGVLASMETCVLEAFAISYHQIQPEVTLEISLLTRRQLWDDLENNNIDLAIMYLPDVAIRNWRPYKTKKIIDEKLLLLHDNPQWLGQSKVSLKKAAQEERAWVMYPRGYYVTELLCEKFKNLLVDVPPCAGRFAAPQQILHFAQTEELYTAFPESFVLAHQEEIQFQTAVLEPEINFELNFVYRKEKINIPRIATFIQNWDRFLQEENYQKRLKSLS
ncbi:LysR family transcriptional regulator [Lactobacillus sp. DCY120]|uniref:LysR family transcriptional regulator n=1 Tax=Bombilactobacillus apium TaxID=2675299 RepID=A0A850RAD5_9LACO|nr:LysR family transcriptional regulator [Bombilactobacillus apium]NVY95788.1 LysR family transcriptional regulator [Bombilactobacillus apium]